MLTRAHEADVGCCQFFRLPVYVGNDVESVDLWSSKKKEKKAESMSEEEE